MKKTLIAAVGFAAMFAFVPETMARHHKHHDNDGLRLAAGIVGLVKAVVAPTPVVVNPAPAPVVVTPPPAPVVVTPPAPVVVATPPPVVVRPPVVVAPPARYHRPAPPRPHHGGRGHHRR